MPAPGPESQDQYEELLSAFREKPGNMKYAGAMAGCDPRTARRAWDKGWPKLGYKAIGEVLREEAVAARKLVEQEAERQRLLGTTSAEALNREREKQQQVEQRAREGRLAQLSRDNSLGLMGIIANCLRGSVELSKKVHDALAAGTTPDGKPISWQQGVALFRNLAYLTRMANEAGKTALEIERVRLGLPSTVVGIATSGEMTPQTAVTLISRAAQTMARAQELGLVVMDGGGEGNGNNGHGQPLEMVASAAAGGSTS